MASRLHPEATNALETGADVPVNVPEHVPVNERQHWFLEQLGAGKKLKAADIADHFTVTNMTAKRDLADLKGRGMIEFIGSPKTGWYRQPNPNEVKPR